MHGCFKVPLLRQPAYTREWAHVWECVQIRVCVLMQAHVWECRCVSWPVGGMLFVVVVVVAAAVDAAVVARTRYTSWSLLALTTLSSVTTFVCPANSCRYLFAERATNPPGGTHATTESGRSTQDKRVNHGNLFGVLHGERDKVYRQVERPHT